MSDSKTEARLAELRDTSAQFAKAFADRVYLEEFRKSKLAILMKEAEANGFTTAAAQDREARAHPQYLELLDGLRQATELSERLRWNLEVAKLGVALYQTRKATERIEMQVYGKG